MADKFVEGLTADRIYVRKGDGLDKETEIQSLVQSIRKHGDITILWVCKAEHAGQTGHVEWLGQGLLRGWIADLAPYDCVVDRTSLTDWLPICRRAWALRFDRQPQHAARSPGNLSFGGWSGSGSAVSELSWEIIAPENGVVMRHRLLADAKDGIDVFGCLRDISPVTGLYVALALIYVPSDTLITAGGLVLLGCASLDNRVLDCSRRNMWQRVWVTATVDKVAFTRLNLCGMTNSYVYSSDWRLETGSFPSALI